MPGAAQTLSVTFTPTDTTNYTTATANVPITVTKATPSITWPTPATIVYGTALSATQLNATASVPGTFVYTPAAGTVLPAGAGADAVGDLHADRHGELHDGDRERADHRHARRRRRSPGRRRPHITYGTALSATQLNATTTGAPAPSSTRRPPERVLTAGSGRRCR